MNVPGVPPNAGISMELDVSMMNKRSAAVEMHCVQSSHERSDVGVAGTAMYPAGGNSHTVPVL